MTFTFKNKVSPFDLIFFGFLALVLLAFNNYISLWDQDEAAYAGFAKRIFEGKDWIIPDFTWSNIHRKPPLHFWLMALSYKLFGINTFAVRFFSAVAVWLSIFLIRFKGKKLLGDRSSLLAAMFMAGNVFILMLGKMAVTDGLLLFFYTWAGLSLADYLIKNRKIALVSFYLSVALGMLVKGPPILLWAGFLWLLLILFFPDKKSVIRTHPWFFGILALLPFGIWIFAVWQQNPGFVRWWTDWYILKRTHSAVLGQTGPPGSYFILFFLFGLAYLPLVWLVFKFIWKYLKINDKTIRFLILWFIAGWLPYEFLPSKLPAYVLAAYPAGALLFGVAAEKVMQREWKIDLRIPLIVQWIIFAGLSIAVPFIYSFKPFPIPERSSVVFFMLFLLLIGVVFLTVWAMKTHEKGYSSHVLVILLFSGIWWSAGLLTLVLPLAESYKNATFRVAKTIENRNKNAGKIIVLNHYAHPPSLIFYLEKYHPSSQIIVPENPDNFFEEKPLFSPGAVYILSRAQWENLPEDVRRKLQAFPVSGISTGSVGKNDYVIIFPND